MRAVLYSALALCCWVGTGFARGQDRVAELVWSRAGSGEARLSFGERPLLEVEASAGSAWKRWRVETGRLRANHPIDTTDFAIRRNAAATGDARHEADITVDEGVAAGLVFRFSPGEEPDGLGVLIDVEAGALRIVQYAQAKKRLELATAAFAFEHGQTYRLGVRYSENDDAWETEVEVDGKGVLRYAAPSRPPRGRQFGFAINEAKARFDNLRVTSGGSASDPIAVDDFETDSLGEYGYGHVEFEVDERPGRIVLEATLPDRGEGMGALARLKHSLGDLKHIHIPQLTPYPGFVIGDHALRSPAIVLANAEVAMALIPDVDDIADLTRRGLHVWLDYQHPESTIIAAVGNYRVNPGAERHVSYESTALKYQGQNVRLRLHVIASAEPEDLANPYGLAARWLWRRWGHEIHARGGSQRAPLTKYCQYVTRWAFAPEPEGWGDTVWQSFRIGDRDCGAPVFIVDVAQHPSVPIAKRRWREPRSVWNQAWFSTQRCANGLMRYARQTGSEDLERKARLMTNFALAAPQTDGLFPAVYTTGEGWYKLYRDTPGWDEARWSNSDRRPSQTTEHAVHVVDAAFTARLLLEWAGMDTALEKEIKAYVLKFADRLCRLQFPDGAFPGWVEPDGSVTPTLAEGPESAMGATLLLELLERYPDHADAARWRRAARGALDYLERGPVAQGRWEDFETYFSCSRWGGDAYIGRRIERNGVFKRNTFSPFWCAEAFLAASRVLEDPRRLALGRRCLDELSLYQQVWDPPFIPVPCHGGFAVMNFDGEWNDARQSLFAPLYLDYYRATGEPEYFERGVAALRASFAMMYCPENAVLRKEYERAHPFFGPESYGFMMENIYHGGTGSEPIGPFNIFSWGNGAALAGAALVRDRYGDLFIDTARGRAFGIDGCDARVEGAVVRISERYGRPSLQAVYAGGARIEVEIADGRGQAPLAPPD